MIPSCENTGPRVRSDMPVQLDKPSELLSVNPTCHRMFVSSPVKLFLRSRHKRLRIRENRTVSSGRSSNRS